MTFLGTWGCGPLRRRPRGETLGCDIRAEEQHDGLAFGLDPFCIHTRGGDLCQCRCCPRQAHDRGRGQSRIQEAGQRRRPAADHHATVTRVVPAPLITRRIARSVRAWKQRVYKVMSQSPAFFVVAPPPALIEIYQTMDDIDRAFMPYMGDWLPPQSPPRDNYRPTPDVQPPELPPSENFDPYRPRSRLEEIESSGLTRRDPDRGVRLAMLKECYSWNGAGGR